MGQIFPGARGARRRRAWPCVAAVALVALAVPLAKAAPAGAVTKAVSTHFIFTATSADVSEDNAYIDNSATNGQPYDMLYVTPNYDPDGNCPCTYDTNPVGVWYDQTVGEWAVFNENSAIMQANESFNVLVIPDSDFGHAAFSFYSDPSTTVGDYTFIENSNADGNPNARVQVTQRLDNAIPTTLNPHPVGVFYDAAAGLWAIFNEDQAPMPDYADFNVLVGTAKRFGGAKTAIVRTTKSDSAGDTTYINNAATNSDPGNITFVTPDYNPGGNGGTYNESPIGVWYPSPQEALFDENGSSPPLQSAYNLLMYPS
jgi:hypothetical protein